MRKKNTIAIVSGHFNPIHAGHIKYIQGAKEISDTLCVIVNNDKQVKIKGSQPFMDEEERQYIVLHIKGVDLAIISIDQDITVCKTIEHLHQLYGKNNHLIFAKGGDRTINNIPEADTCRKLGIKMVFNVGGKKTQSSSSLLRKLQKEGEPK